MLQKEGFSIMKTSVDLPKATKKRITQLLQILKTWESKKITSVEISNLTGWKNSLIRHDFWYLRNFQNQKAKDNSDLLKDSDNFFGVSNGYNVEKLKELIFEVLGGSPFSALEKSECKEKLYKNCCLVGISNFGETFLHSSTVQDSSFLLKAGFDTNLNLVEITSSPFPLFHTNSSLKYIFLSFMRYITSIELNFPENIIKPIVIAHFTFVNISYFNNKISFLRPHEGKVILFNRGR